MQIAVNFHYIGMPQGRFPAIFGFSQDQLRSLLLSLKRQFEILSQDCLMSRLLGSQKPPVGRPECVITFDDGLRCQYIHAAPILEELNIPAVFFIPCDPYLHGKALLVHRLAWLRSEFGNEVIMEHFRNLDCEIRGPHDISTVDIQSARSIYSYDPVEVAVFKYFFNFVLPKNLVELTLDSIFKQAGLSAQEFIRDFYMSETMVQALGALGFVGSHGITHRSLANMSQAAIEAELRGSKSCLEKMTGRKIFSISYPNGQLTPEVSRIAENSGYRLGYTMQREVNRGNAHPLRLPRFDCTDLQSERSPFELCNN